MPAIVGPVAIGNNTNGGVSHFGDAFVISPKTPTKNVFGSGAASTGNAVVTFNGISVNNKFDINAVDQPIAGTL